MPSYPSPGSPPQAYYRWGDVEQSDGETIVRRYDSPTARLVEAARAVAWDAQSAATWAGFLVERIDKYLLHEELESPEEYRSPKLTSSQSDEFVLWTYRNAAFWRAAIVTLFAHYKQAPNPRIRQLYEEAMLDLPAELGIRTAFERWEQVRDKAIAIPLATRRLIP